MPFSNVWDTTFPPDTQLANLLGQDIRNGVKVDVQQRMAAISGLDAAKPAFSGDAQPANWNGILFFATDTGKIYQWNNPSWTDVTSSFVKGASQYKNVTPTTHTGTTTEDTIFTSTALSALSVSGIYRVNLMLNPNAQGVSSATLRVRINGTQIDNPSIQQAAQNISLWVEWIFNTLPGAPNKLSIARRTSYAQNATVLSGIQDFNNGSINFDPTAGSNTFTITLQNGNNSDSQTFSAFFIELL